MVAAVIGILASIGYVSIVSLGESTRVEKLRSDVAVINSAIQTYRVSGGNSLATTNPQTAVDQLKKSATSATATTIAGLTGGMVDKRLRAVMQTSAEAARTEERAIFSQADQRFEIAMSGGAGVRQFVLDDALAAVDPGTEDRAPATKLADNGWVWDYTDREPAARPGGPALAGTAAAPAALAPPTPTADPLTAPTFSPGDGSYELTAYPMMVSVNNPNPGGSSKVLYSLNGAPEDLYTNAIEVDPGATLTARAVTVDPDRWIDGGAGAASYAATPYQLEVSVSPAAPTLTYQQAGGAIPGVSPLAPAPALAAITNLAQINERYRPDPKIWWRYDGGDPLAGDTPVEQSSPSPASIDVSVGRWAASSALTIRASAEGSSSETITFLAGEGNASVAATPTALGAPTIVPGTGIRSADVPVTIEAAAGGPTGEQIYYTLDGLDPGDNNGSAAGGTLYAGEFLPGAGTAGVLVVTARTYGPPGASQWFTPSSPATATYTSITTPEGALVGSATLNGTFVGSLIYATPASGSMNSITFNSNARILNGNLYLPGTPTVRRTSGTVWSPANDDQFAAVIQGWEFNAAGQKTVQTTPRVIDEDGSIQPTNYSVTFNNNALLEGKVVRRHDSPAFPEVAPPPPPQSSGSTSLNSPPPGPISATQFSNVTINSSGVGDVRLNPGNFNNLTANNGTAFVLGDPNNPDVPQYYSFNNLTLNSNSDLKIVGKVVITVGNSITINSGSVLGNSANPDWLQMQFSSGNFTANSGSTMYGQLVIPTGSVTFNANSVFTGSVTANFLTINSNSVVFNLPPVIEN